jgi:trk system potassium uptake protein
MINQLCMINLSLDYIIGGTVMVIAKHILAVYNNIYSLVAVYFVPVKEQSINTQNTGKTEKLIFRVPRVPSLRVPFLKIPRPANPLSSTLLLVYGFGALIILGTILLVLPVSSNSSQVTSPVNAFFTAVSAVCVTGLVVLDTGTYWSSFGQAVLFSLFQIGGFGFIVGATLLLLAIGGRLGLKERLTVSESLGLDQLGGVLGIVVKLAVFSLFVEGIGAVIFYYHWTITANPGVSFWQAVFHAASAFNNCGMELFGNYQSLTGHQGDAITLLITALLVILGGTGYIVIADSIRHRSFRKVSLDSKVVLTVTFSLLIAGTLFYLIAEYSRPATLGTLPFGQKVLVAFFQSVTARTAGFSAINVDGLAQISLFFSMFLMFIGGAAGSTAGGIKVNTLGVLAMTALSLVKGRGNIEAFGRQLTHQTVYRAITLFLVYLGIVGLIIIALSITEVFPFDKLLFETFSAMSTVGLSTGITPDLSSAGKIIISFAMFMGRLGPLALMAWLVQRQRMSDMDYPHENIRLG